MLDPDRERAESTATVGEELPLADSPIVILAPGSHLGERYEIRGVLGSGGSSVVYRALDRELRREVALKVLRSDRLDEGSLTRFRREAAAARDTASPRLVRVFDIGRTGNAVFLPMELVEGTTLKAVLRNGPLPVDKAVALCIEVLEALSVIHAVGLVHRDVKPSNILLTTDGEVKVGDLGLAFRMDGSDTRATRTEAVVGTLEYLSPEQALGEPLDVRSDIFSAGVVLYEMLTGALPWSRSSNLGLLLARVGETAPDVRKVRPEAPRWLARVVAGMLRRRTEERYASVDAVVADLSRSRAPRLLARTLVARRRGLSLTVAALAAALVLTITPIWLAGRDDFSHLASTESGLIAVSRQGEKLWSADGVAAINLAPARLDRHGIKVVGIRSPAADYTSDQRHRLSVIDPQTGDVLETVQLPNGAVEFPEHLDRFGASVWTLDLNDDGIDEVLVTYFHVPSYPSYVVLYEPRVRRSRILFAGSGHHHFAGAVDVDGDGRREVLLLGTNNRMGWYATLAAVQVKPWIDKGQRGVVPLTTNSPDRPVSGIRQEPLWYALLPNGFCNDPQTCLSFDPQEGRIEIAFNHGERVSVDFDGFVSGASEIANDLRQEHRRVAYRRSREGMRKLRVGLADEAVVEIDAALEQARAALDPLLEEWLMRARGAVLAAAGRVEEAEESFRALVDSSGRRPDVAFDAAKAFHLAGDLDRAVTWYERGVGDGDNTRGRPKEDFILGAVLALVEKGHHAQAKAVALKFEAAFPHLASGNRVLNEYVRWRQGELPRTDVQVDHSASDLRRYWMLEFRLARGESPDEVLSEVEAELSQSSDSTPMLLGLQAEVLSRLGRRPEAVLLAARADALGSVRRSENVEVRAHADLIHERYERLRAP